MYNLNINKSSIVPTNLIVGRVLDKPFDTIQFKIHDGLDVMDLTGCTLEFRGTTPDNKKVTSNVIKILDAKSGEIEFTFPPNFYSAKGHFQNAYFVIKKGTNSESTNDLLITVLNAVDFNLDDAPIIIDQLDDLIQAVIDDLNNQLSKVKGDIKQTQDNITTLKKDVDAYKGQFNTEISKMQKQLDDLAKAINQTDIQRPQITTPNGRQLYYFESSKTFHEMVTENVKSTGYFKVQSFITKDQPEQYINGMLNVSLANLENPNYYSYTFIGTGVNTGNEYSYTFHANSNKGWKRLNGQVPKITTDEGRQFDMNDRNKTMLEFAKILGAGTKKVYIHNAVGIPEQYLHGLMNIASDFSVITFEGSAVISGNAYSFSHLSGVDKGWKRLDGQVYQVTPTTGGTFITFDNTSKSAMELFQTERRDYQAINMINSSGQPEQYLIGKVQTTPNGLAGIFVGTSSVTGNTYSYGYNNGKSDGWKRLDGQVSKITKDDGSFRHIVSESTIDTYDYITSLGSGTFSIYLHTTNGQPENFIAGIVNQTENGSGKMEGIFIGSALSTGNVYSYAYAASGVKGWKRLDRLEYGIATQSQNGLMLSTDKVKLDGLEKHSNATQSKSGLMSSTDKKVLDDLNYSVSTKFIPSGNASLSSHSGLPQTIERDGKFVTFKVVLTGALKGEVVGTIPPEYRPTYKVFKSCSVNTNRVMRVIIGTDGIVEYGTTPPGVSEITKEESVMLTFTYKI